MEPAVTLPPERFFQGDQLELARALHRGDLAAVRALAPNTDLRTLGAEGTSVAHYALHAAVSRAPERLAALGALAAADPAVLHLPHAELGSVLECCLASAHPEFLAALLDAGVDPDTAVRGETPSLVAAAADGATANVGLLVDRGARLEARDPVGATALVAALTASHLDAVELLVARGADVRTADDFGVSFFYMLAIVLEDEGEDSPLRPRLLALRDRYTWDGVGSTPEAPAVVRERMRERGLTPLVPPGAER